MAKDFSRAFYASADWERARDAALTRDAHLCQHCLAQGEITPAVMVHHITELTPANVNDPDGGLRKRRFVPGRFERKARVPR